MRLRTIFLPVFAVAALAGCTDSGESPAEPVPANGDAAYLSVRIETRKTTRSSGESPGEDESDLQKLCFIAFNDRETVVKAPGTTAYFTEVSPVTATSEVFKVSSGTVKLLAIANPGPKLEAVLRDMNGTTTYATFNKAVTVAGMTEIADDTRDIDRGFAMINSGDETDRDAGDVIADPLIDVSDNVVTISKDMDAEAAKEAAGDNPAEIKIERLASKVALTLADEITVRPEGADFTFGHWTLDALNTAFYPFAEKTLLEVSHTAGGSYVRNFYTRDPNFSGTVGEGIDNATVDADTFDPVLVEPYDWMIADSLTYCIENTMDAGEQRFGNATRVVIRATYYPKDYSGDWFNFAGQNFADLAALQLACSKAGSDSNLAAACKRMFDKIAAYAAAHNIRLEGSDFASLKEADLAAVSNGGEVLKEGREDIIRWYQDGLCYYYYEIVHDNETQVEQDFGKYGVVRNNWYALTLGSVDGPGTPWYPDIDEPGPGDPDPEDPIDGSGYLGITVEVAPWIVWETGIGL